MADGGPGRTLSDLFARLGRRRTEAAVRTPTGVTLPPEADDSGFVFHTKAFRKFLSVVESRSSPAILDLGPVVGPNVTFFAERLGCKIFVEDILADIEQLARLDALDTLSDRLGSRFVQPDGIVDGVLCWDLIDYLDRESARVLAGELTRLLRPGGALLGFFATVEEPVTSFTKYVVVDDFNFKQKPYGIAPGRQPVLMNREIMRLFEDLEVSDSYLLQINTREILFRKPVNPGQGR